MTVDKAEKAGMIETTENRRPHDKRRDDRQPIRAEDIVPQVEFVVEPTVGNCQSLWLNISALTNRAYAMAEVAHMVLAAGDRYRVIFRVKSGNGEGAKKNPTPGRQPNTFRLVRCKTDGSVWLSRDEAVAHFLNTPELLKKFYEIEEVTTEAPKGNFSVIAICGLSGTILGPPNHHEYQQNIASLHRSRFANMPLEKFKSRIEMRRDEETIEQWKEQMSTSRHYRVQTEKSEVSSKSHNKDAELTPVVEETTPDTADEKLPVEETSSDESTSTDESSNEELTEEPVTETSDDPANAETETKPASEEQIEESDKEEGEASETFRR